MNKIKEMRYNIGLSQQQLAEKIGVSRQTMAYIENGHIDACSPETLRKLCGFFGISPFDVVGLDSILNIKPNGMTEALRLIDMIKERYL